MPCHSALVFHNTPSVLFSYFSAGMVCHFSASRGFQTHFLILFFNLHSSLDLSFSLHLSSRCRLVCLCRPYRIVLGRLIFKVSPFFSQIKNKCFSRAGFSTLAPWKVYLYSGIVPNANISYISSVCVSVKHTLITNSHCITPAKMEMFLLCDLISLSKLPQDRPYTHTPHRHTRTHTHTHTPLIVIHHYMILWCKNINHSWSPWPSQRSASCSSSSDNRMSSSYRLCLHTHKHTDSHTHRFTHTHSFTHTIFILSTIWNEKTLNRHYNSLYIIK